MDSVQLAGVALAALLSENFILVNCLGIGTRVEAFHSTTAARRTGLSLTLAMVVTVFFTWCADFLVLRHFGWVYLRTLVFSLIALLTVFLLRKAARLWPELSHRIDADLASVSTNCAVLGAAYLAAQRSYTLSQALTFALCGGLGVLVVLMSYAGLREEISLTSCPRPFRGPGHRDGNCRPDGPGPGWLLRAAPVLIRKASKRPAPDIIRCPGPVFCFSLISAQRRHTRSPDNCRGRRRCSPP